MMSDTPCIGMALAANIAGMSGVSAITATIRKP